MSTKLEGLKHTAFFHLHKRHNAQLVEFAGWAMPLEYTSIIGEHRRVRETVGLFDVSHMGRLEARGEMREVLDFASYVTTNSLRKLSVGRAQYTLLCNESGGVIDDLLLYRFDDRLLFVVNAANREKDFTWLRQHRPEGVELEDKTDEIAELALQGPKAQDVLIRAIHESPNLLREMKFSWFQEVDLAGIPAMISRTGYTGEDGFEIYFPARHAEEVWRMLLEAGEGVGIEPCGLGARDTLRLEMNYRLYGVDMDETTTPYEADLSWVVKLKKGDFIGRDALVKQKERGLTRRLAGFEVLDKGIPYQRYPIFHCREVSASGGAPVARQIGEVASGSYSPSLNKGIGVAYLPIELTKIGTGIGVKTRIRMLRAQIAATPFYKEGSRR